MKGDIQVVSFVVTEDGRVPVEELPSKARKALAVHLKETWINELFRGLGQVTAENETK